MPASGTRARPVRPRGPRPGATRSAGHKRGKATSPVFRALETPESPWGGSDRPATAFDAGERPQPPAARTQRFERWLQAQQHRAAGLLCGTCGESLQPACACRKEQLRAVADAANSRRRGSAQTAAALAASGDVEAPQSRRFHERASPYGVPTDVDELVKAHRHANVRPKDDREMLKEARQLNAALERKLHDALARVDSLTKRTELLASWVQRAEARAHEAAAASSEENSALQQQLEEAEARHAAELEAARSTHRAQMDEVRRRFEAGPVPDDAVAELQDLRVSSAARIAELEAEVARREQQLRAEADAGARCAGCLALFSLKHPGAYRQDSRFPYKPQWSCCQAQSEGHAGCERSCSC